LQFSKEKKHNSFELFQISQLIDDYLLGAP
jgi:hypothetical protein